MSYVFICSNHISIKIKRLNFWKFFRNFLKFWSFFRNIWNFSTWFDFVEIFAFFARTKWVLKKWSKIEALSLQQTPPPHTHTPTRLFSLLVQLVLGFEMAIRKKGKTWQMEMKNMVFRKMYVKHETEQNLVGKECLKTQMWRRKECHWTRSWSDSPHLGPRYTWSRWPIQLNYKRLSR